MAEDDLLTRVVNPWTKDESPTLLRLANRPARKGAGDVDHVLLGVSAVYAQGVELEQLAAVVLVEPVGHAARVVEIEQHGRTLRHRAEQFVEFPERAGTNDVPVELSQVVRLGCPLLREDAEMVFPEIGEHFLKLPLASDGTRDAGRL